MRWRRRASSARDWPGPWPVVRSRRSRPGSGWSWCCSSSPSSSPPASTMKRTTTAATCGQADQRLCASGLLMGVDSRYSRVPHIGWIATLDRFPAAAPLGPMTKATQRRYAALDGLRGHRRADRVRDPRVDLPAAEHGRAAPRLVGEDAPVRGPRRVRDVLRAVGLPAVPRVRTRGAGRSAPVAVRQLPGAPRGAHRARLLPRAGRDARAAGGRRATCRGGGWWTPASCRSSSCSRRTTRRTRC